MSEVHFHANVSFTYLIVSATVSMQTHLVRYHHQTELFCVFFGLLTDNIYHLTFAKSLKVIGFLSTSTGDLRCVQSFILCCF